jgi:hypothetical protein
LYIKGGQLVHAEDDQGRGLEAALRAVGLDQVTIEIRQGALPPHRTISVPITELLMESARLRDEGGRELLLDDVDLLFADPPDADERGLLLPSSLPEVPELASPPRLDTERIAELPPRERNQAMNVKQTLEAAMQIEGAIGVALVDHQSGMTLGMSGGGSVMNMEVAAAANTNVVRSKLKALQSLGLKDKIEDILITLSTQYHLIRIMEKHPNFFIYIALNREQANLAMARHRLTDMERALLM